MKVCFDAFAVLAWLHAEPSAPTVRAILVAAAEEADSAIYISEVSLGELYYRLGRIRGLVQAETFWWEVLSGSLPLTTVQATTPRIRAAARIKAEHLVSYADAFVIGTALELGVPIVTGDKEILAAREALGFEVIELA